MGLGYGTEDDPPECSINAPTISDLDIDIDESLLYIVAQMGDDLPSTSLLWGEECIPNDDRVDSSTSMKNDPNESKFRDRQC